ncbi:MAG: peroxiredoxin Q/BCP [Rhodothermales bacterium]|jgi:peroxiredoxin Q/BCP
MALNLGDPAPYFAGITHDGDRVTLEECKGTTVVLYFYPKDDTPGCRKEACSLRDGYDELTKRNVFVIGVSPDSVASHRKFVEKYSLPFMLVADMDRAIIDAYEACRARWLGALGIRRISYVIGPDGRILHIFRKVDTRNHAQQILDFLDTLPKKES